MEQQESELTLEVLFAKLKLNPDDVLNVYLLGSRLWGTATPASDYDIVVVMRDTYVVSDGELLISVEDVDAYVCNVVTFEEGLVDHILFHLMALCLPPKFVWLQRHTFSFDLTQHLSLAQLRASVSCEAARTWCKAMKKFTVEDKPALSRKDIIHCLRELLLGIELARTRTIQHFDAANHLYEQMMGETSQEWEYYKKKYKPTYNKLSSELRAAAPKAEAKPRREHLKNPTSPEDIGVAKERVKEKWNTLLATVASERNE